MRHIAAIAFLASAGLAPAQRPPAAPAGVQILNQVPAPFRGGWDEIDDCSQREPRFSITATSLYNFEVRWQVRQVRMISPTRIDIVTRFDDPETGLTEEEATWSFRLVDGGRAITAGNGAPPRFLRCGDVLGRE
jgi:hypothetical protein